MFVYSAKVKAIESLLGKRYVTFVHRTCKAVRQGKRLLDIPRPTVSGLLFVQGDDPREIQQYLDENNSGAHLVVDCYTRKINTINDSEMQTFMLLSQLDTGMVRFMPNNIDYYSVGHTPITVTSGILRGLSGYVVRIAREKRLVTRMGGMTIAISGICKETFENADEYVFRRKLQQGVRSSADATLTAEQQDIDRCFFDVQNYIDMLAVSKGIAQWVRKANFMLRNGNLERACDICVFILEEIGSRLSHHTKPFAESINALIAEVCRDVMTTVNTIYNHPNVTVALRERIDGERLSIHTRFPRMVSIMSQLLDGEDNGLSAPPKIFYKICWFVKLTQHHNYAQPHYIYRSPQRPTC